MKIDSIPYNDVSVDTREISRDRLVHDEPKVQVPTEVTKAIADQIQDLEKQVEEDGGTAIQRDTQFLSNQQEFLMDVIDKLQMLLHELEKNTEEGVKRAQIAWAQIPNYMWKYIPTVVSQFIYTTKASSGDSLLGSFYHNKPFEVNDK